MSTTSSLGSSLLSRDQLTGLIDTALNSKEEKSINKQNTFNTRVKHLWDAFKEKVDLGPIFSEIPFSKSTCPEADPADRIVKLQREEFDTILENLIRSTVTEDKIINKFSGEKDAIKEKLENVKKYITSSAATPAAATPPPKTPDELTVEINNLIYFMEDPRCPPEEKKAFHHPALIECLKQLIEAPKTLHTEEIKSLDDLLTEQIKLNEELDKFKGDFKEQLKKEIVSSITNNPYLDQYSTEINTIVASTNDSTTKITEADKKKINDFIKLSYFVTNNLLKKLTQEKSNTEYLKEIQNKISSLKETINNLSSKIHPDDSAELTNQDYEFDLAKFDLAVLNKTIENLENLANFFIQIQEPIKLNLNDKTITIQNFDDAKIKPIAPPPKGAIKVKTKDIKVKAKDIEVKAKDIEVKAKDIEAEDKDIEAEDKGTAYIQKITQKINNLIEIFNNKFYALTENNDAQEYQDKITDLSKTYASIMHELFSNTNPDISDTIIRAFSGRTNDDSQIISHDKNVNISDNTNTFIKENLDKLYAMREKMQLVSGPLKKPFNDSSIPEVKLAVTQHLINNFKPADLTHRINTIGGFAEDQASDYNKTWHNFGRRLQAYNPKNLFRITNNHLNNFFNNFLPKTRTEEEFIALKNTPIVHNNYNYNNKKDLKAITLKALFNLNNHFNPLKALPELILAKLSLAGMRINNKNPEVPTAKQCQVPLNNKYAGNSANELQMDNFANILKEIHFHKEQNKPWSSNHTSFENHLLKIGDWQHPTDSPLKEKDLHKINTQIQHRLNLLMACLNKKEFLLACHDNNQTSIINQYLNLNAKIGDSLAKTKEGSDETKTDETKKISGYLETLNRIENAVLQLINQEESTTELAADAIKKATERRFLEKFPNGLSRIFTAIHAFKWQFWTKNSVRIPTTIRLISFKDIMRVRSLTNKLFLGVQKLSLFAQTARVIVPRQTVTALNSRIIPPADRKPQDKDLNSLIKALKNINPVNFSRAIGKPQMANDESYSVPKIDISNINNIANANLQFEGFFQFGDQKLNAIELLQLTVFLMICELKSISPDKAPDENAWVINTDNQIKIGYIKDEDVANKFKLSKNKPISIHSSQEKIFSFDNITNLINKKISKMKSADPYIENLSSQITEKLKSFNEAGYDSYRDSLLTKTSPPPTPVK